jgi:hypothetical protein
LILDWTESGPVHPGNSISEQKKGSISRLCGQSLESRRKGQSIKRLTYTGRCSNHTPWRHRHCSLPNGEFSLTIPSRNRWSFELISKANRSKAMQDGGQHQEVHILFSGSSFLQFPTLSHFVFYSSLSFFLLLFFCNKARVRWVCL